MGLEQKRNYRSDDRDLENRDNTLVVNMGGNGDWYVMIVKTGEKYGPTVRVTTSGAMQGQNMAAPAVGNLYRALGGERPFVLINRDELEQESNVVEPNVIWVSNYRRFGHDEQMPIRVLDDGTVEAIIPRQATADVSGWHRLSAERPATWAWKHVFEDLTFKVEELKKQFRQSTTDVSVGSSPPPHLSPSPPLPSHIQLPSPAHEQEVMTLRQQVTNLQSQLEAAQAQAAADRAEAERWRKDAVEDKPAREVLEEVRGMLGLSPGQPTTIAVQRLVYKAENLTNVLQSIGSTITENIDR